MNNKGKVYFKDNKMQKMNKKVNNKILIMYLDQEKIYHQQ